MGYRELGPAGLAVVKTVDGALNSQDTHLLIAPALGGADSLALAFAARHVAIRRYLEYTAVVIDHQLQQGSTRLPLASSSSSTGFGYDERDCTAVQVGPVGDRPLGQKQQPPAPSGPRYLRARAFCHRVAAAPHPRRPG